MPTPTRTPGNEKQDELNRSQADYDRRFNDLVQAEKSGSPDMSDFERNYQENADSSQEDNNVARASERLRDKESEGSAPQGSWINNAKGNQQSQKGTAWWKRKGTWFGIGGGGLGIAAMLGLGGLAPAFLLPNLAQNGVAMNDIRSGILEQRLVQKLTKIMGSTGGDTTCRTVSRCNAGKMPKSLLSAMEKKGIKPLNADGTDFTDSSRGKYVNTNPSGYAIDDGKGGTRTVKASEFVSEYKKNPSFRKSVKSAKNMLTLGYSGVYMLINFFKPNGLKRDGGLASDPDVNEKNVGEKFDEKIKPKPETTTEDGVKSKFRDRLSKLLKKIGVKLTKASGDPIIAVGLGACTLAAIPQFASTTWRAIQAVQLGALLMDGVLSPAGAQQAGQIDGAKLAAIGGMLTQQVDGKSALDSPVLQSAIGVNKNPVTVSKYAPGYTLLSSPAVQAANQANAAIKPGCDLISTPQAAIASAAIYGAISAVSAGTGAVVIGAFKGAAAVAAGLGAIQILMDAAENSGLLKAIADGAYAFIQPLIPNIASTARAADLGDALGSAMLTFFPLAGLAGGGAVLTTDQVQGVSDDMARLNDERREEAIATLSPFDTSSQYTFLGSIMSNLSLHSVQGNPIQSSLSMAGYMLSSPFGLLTKKASAAGNTTTSCGYAESFGIDPSIAINAAGYPCVGIPSQYMNMSVDEVYNLVSDQLDPETGEPKDDSDIMLMMGDCSEGDLESVTGCTIKGTPAVNTSERVCTVDEDGEKTCTKMSLSADAVSDKERAAQSLYLFDMQVEDILTGDDSETAYDSDGASDLLAFYDASSDASIDEFIAQQSGGLSTKQTALASNVLFLANTLSNSLKSVGETVKNTLHTFSQVPLMAVKTTNIVVPRSPYWMVVGV